MAECPDNSRSTSYAANFEGQSGIPIGVLTSMELESSCCLTPETVTSPAGAPGPAIARETTSEQGKLVMSDRESTYTAELSPPDSGVSSGSTAHFLCPCGKTSIRHFMRRAPSCLVRGNQNVFPELDIQLSSDAQKTMNRQLKRKTANLLQHFANLKSYTRMYLESFPEIEDILRSRIESRNKLTDASLKFKELFDIESKCSDFINYRVLKDLLSVCFSKDATSGRLTNEQKQAEEHLKIYEREFKSFAENRVFSLPGELNLFRETSIEGPKLRIKIEVDPENFTFDQIDEFEEVVRDILHIPSYVELCVVTVQRGCVEIVYKAIGSIESDLLLLCKEQKVALVKRKITLLEFEGKVIYCCCDFVGDSESEELVHLAYEGAFTEKEHENYFEIHTLECSQKTIRMRMTCEVEVCQFCNVEFNSCQMKYHQFECKDMVLLSDGSGSLSCSESDDMCDFADLSVSSGIASEGSTHEVIKPEGTFDHDSYYNCPHTDCLTLADLLKYHKDKFPVQVEVCQGLCGADEESSFSSGDQLKVNFKKDVKFVAFEYENGSKFSVPENSPSPFALLYNPNNNLHKAMNGYCFEKVTDVLKMDPLPLIMRQRQPGKSTSEDDLIIAKSVKNGLRKSLKVYSILSGREKALDASCDGPFSTKPEDLKLNLVEILNLPEIKYGCKLVMFDKRAHDEDKLPAIVTMLQTSVELHLAVTSAHEAIASHVYYPPATLDICVRLLSPESTKTYTECPVTKSNSLENQTEFYATVPGDDISQRPPLEPPQDNQAQRQYSYVKNHPRTSKASVPLSTSAIRQPPEKSDEPASSLPAVCRASAGDMSSCGSTGSGSACVVSRPTSEIHSGSDVVKDNVHESKQVPVEQRKENMYTTTPKLIRSPTHKFPSTDVEELVPEVVYGKFTDSQRAQLSNYSLYEIVGERKYTHDTTTNSEPNANHSRSFSSPSSTTCKAPHTCHNTL